MAIIQREPLEEPPHWEPFRGIERLHQKMDHFFDRFSGGHSEVRSLTFVPSAEMEETKNTIHLRLEVPGMKAEDLDVQVTDTSIEIKGERKSESTTKEKGMICSEFHYGKFERKIPLPAPIQTNKVQAECKNGVLTLSLPKVESEQRQAIEFNIN